MKRRIIPLSIVMIILLPGCVQRNVSSNVELYRVFKVSLRAKNAVENPYLDGPGVTAIFEGKSGNAKGLTYRITGFWDGENTWKIRFAPLKTGTWSYETTSVDPGLNRKRGTFTATPPSQDKISTDVLYHGFLEKNDSFSWKLSDRTPFLPVGETQ